MFFRLKNSNQLINSKFADISNSQTMQTGGESILLVEDEPAILLMAKRMLERLEAKKRLREIMDASDSL